MAELTIIMAGYDQPEAATLDYRALKKLSHRADLTIDGMAVNGHRLVLQDGGKELERTCTNCHRRQPLSQFGLRLMGRGEVRVQAYCTTCRNEKR